MAMTFHWVIALLLLVTTGLALFREAFGAQAVWMISAHRITGLAILVPAVGRLAWRLTHRPPPLPPTVGRREAWVANAVYALLYFLAIFVPIAGWIFVSMAPEGRPLDYRGPDNIPELPLPVDDRASFAWHEVHEILGFAFIGAFLLHIGGVLRHEVLGQGAIAERMLPRPRWFRLLIAAAVVLWLLGLSLDLLGVRISRGVLAAPRDLPV
jgi:cytochrome b561